MCCSSELESEIVVCSNTDQRRRRKLSRAATCARARAAPRAGLAAQQDASALDHAGPHVVADECRVRLRVERPAIAGGQENKHEVRAAA